MEADNKKKKLDHPTDHSDMKSTLMGHDHMAPDELNGDEGRSALLSVQAELRTVVQMARVLANEGSPLSEKEAKKTANDIASLLKASGDAFGEEAVLFQELIPERAKNLLR